MKTTAYILILLMFGMAFAPCGDSSEMGTPQQVEQISKTSIAGAVDIEYGMEKQQEECSPICPCQCCPSIATDIIKLSEIDILSPLAHTTEDKLSVYSTFRFSIWSPPRYLS